MLIEVADIKAIAEPRDVARRFLGEPEFIRGKNNWYCSPFRNEEHPSFKVDEFGMYDFGSNESYDIFRFVRELQGCSFKESIDILASMYGIAEREYTDSSIIEWYKKQREEQKAYQKFLHKFYLMVWDEVDKEYHENKECIEIFKEHPEMEAYAICLHRQPEIWGLEEYLAQEIDTWEDEEELFQSTLKGDLPTWLMNRIKATSMWLDLIIKQPQKREY